MTSQMIISHKAWKEAFDLNYYQPWPSPELRAKPSFAFFQATEQIFNRWETEHHNQRIPKHTHHNHWSQQGKWEKRQIKSTHIKTRNRKIINKNVYLKLCNNKLAWIIITINWIRKRLILSKSIYLYGRRQNFNQNSCFENFSQTNQGKNVIRHIMPQLTVD